MDSSIQAKLCTYFAWLFRPGRLHFQPCFDGHACFQDAVVDAIPDGLGCLACWTIQACEASGTLAFALLQARAMNMQQAMSSITSLTAPTWHTFIGSSDHCPRMRMVPCTCSCGINTRRLFVMRKLFGISGLSSHGTSQYLTPLVVVAVPRSGSSAHTACAWNSSRRKISSSFFPQKLLLNGRRDSFFTSLSERSAAIDEPAVHLETSDSYLCPLAGTPPATTAVLRRWLKAPRSRDCSAYDLLNWIG